MMNFCNVLFYYLAIFVDFASIFLLHWLLYFMYTYILRSCTFKYVFQQTIHCFSSSEICFCNFVLLTIFYLTKSKKTCHNHPSVIIIKNMGSDSISVRKDSNICLLVYRKNLMFMLRCCNKYSLNWHKQKAMFIYFLKMSVFTTKLWLYIT